MAAHLQLQPNSMDAAQYLQLQDSQLQQVAYRIALGLHFFPDVSAYRRCAGKHFLLVGDAERSGARACFCGVVTQAWWQ